MDDLANHLWVADCVCHFKEVNCRDEATPKDFIMQITSMHSKAHQVAELCAHLVSRGAAFGQHIIRG